MTLNDTLFNTRKRHKTALVVDQDTPFRGLIAGVIKRQDYTVIEGDNGHQAIELYQQHHPDLLIINTVLPKLDGISVVQCIKEVASADDCSSIVFISECVDESEMTRCILVGGDDFIHKPFTPALLNAKLIALGRSRAMFRALRDAHNQVQRDQEIAEDIFSRAVLSGNVHFAGLQTMIRPASTFSGDILLTTARPNGDLNVLLGDFTGHGLAAAIGALPVSDTFRSMTAKGYSGPEIIHQISQKLCRMLPTGMFFSAAMVTISHEYNTVSVWNGGMPDIWLLSNKRAFIKNRFHSQYPPLGIMPVEDRGLHFEVIDLCPGETLLLSSDGLLEAQNPEGEFFGEERYWSAVHQGIKQKDILNTLAQCLEDFSAGRPLDDDITLAAIPFDHQALATVSKPQKSPVAEITSNRHWQWSIALKGQTLRQTDIVPVAMHQIQEMLHSQQNTQQIYTVLTELYINALDHGVLQLPSSLKTSAEGFAQYFTEREQRLESLEQGSVEVKLAFVAEQGRSRMQIDIVDSGCGFDIDHWARNWNNEHNLSGRGLNLVLELTSELIYHPPGNHVTAILEWDSEPPKTAPYISTIDDQLLDP